MGGVAGVELIYAVKKAATWGTAVACGALNGFLSRASGIKESSDVEVDDSLGLYYSGDDGAVFFNQGCRGNIHQQGRCSGYY